MKVNVEVLDDDHQKLFEMMNELHESITAGHDKNMLREIIARLLKRTKTHLDHEEHLLEQTGDPGLAAHKLEHDRMKQRSRKLYDRFESGSLAVVSIELKSFLQNWWLMHIQGADKQYGPYLNSKGIH
jgi:hemerythrin-like metal-binding protein